MNRRPTLFLIATTTITALLLAGCGESADKGCVVEGKLSQGGVPLDVEGRAVGEGFVEVKLVPTFPAAPS